MINSLWKIGLISSPTQIHISSLFSFYFGFDYLVCVQIFPCNCQWFVMIFFFSFSSSSFHSIHSYFSFSLFRSRSRSFSFRFFFVHHVKCVCVCIWNVHFVWNHVHHERQSIVLKAISKRKILTLPGWIKCGGGGGRISPPDSSSRSGPLSAFERPRPPLIVFSSVPPFEWAFGSCTLNRTSWNSGPTNEQPREPTFCCILAKPDGRLPACVRVCVCVFFCGFSVLCGRKEKKKDTENGKYK